MSEPLLGQIQPFAFNYAPQGWALCNGQTLPLGQNQAIFGLLGVAFGGDGRNTVGLPNLNGRVIMGQGAYSDAYGSVNYAYASAGGTRLTPLNTSNLPPHNHSAVVTAGGSTSLNVSIGATTDVAATTLSSPENGSVLGALVTSGVDSITVYAPANTPTNVTLGGVSVSGGSTINSVQIGNTGGGTPFSNMQPYLAMVCAIAIEGIWPTRP